MNPCLDCTHSEACSADREHRFEQVREYVFRKRADAIHALTVRALEKQASRDEDARRLAAGEISHEELRKENAFISDELIAKSTFNWSDIVW